MVQPNTLHVLPTTVYCNVDMFTLPIVSLSSAAHASDCSCACISVNQVVSLPPDLFASLPYLCAWKSARLLTTKAF